MVRIATGPSPATGFAARIALACVVLAGCHADRTAPGNLVAQVRIDGGQTSASTPFTYIVQMVAGPNLLLVTQREEQQILAYDAEGRYLRTIGRSGAGPGEFSGLGSIGLLGDTLWTIDTNLRRISFFTAHDGRYIASMRYEADIALSGAAEHFYFPYPEQLLADGTMLGVGGSVGRLIAEGLVTREPTLRMTRAGKTLDTLAWASLTHRSLIIRGSRGTLYSQQPFGDGVIVAYGPAVRRIFVVDRTAATSAGRSEYTVTAIRTDGDTLWSRRYDYVPTRLDGHEADSVRERVHRAYGARYTTAEVDEALFVPRFLTPVTAAIAGEDGTLWLRREEPRFAHRPVEYDVIGADGRVVGHVTAPANVRLRWVSGTTAWGEELDADDVPVLVRYRVDMRQPGQP